MFAAFSLVLCSLQIDAIEQGLDKPISASYLAETLPEISRRITRQTGIKIDVPTIGQELKATVLIHDRKLRDVLDALASVLDLTWARQDRGVAFLAKESFQQRLTEYARLEDRFLFDRVTAALKALSLRLTTNVPPSKEAPMKLTDAVLANPDKLQQWAQSNVSRPEYRTLAHYFQAGIISDIRFGGWPNSYSIGQLNNVSSESYKVRSSESPQSPYNGTHVLIKYHHLTGDLQFVNPQTGKRGALEPDQPLIKYAKPPTALSGTAFAKYLANWEGKPLSTRDKLLTQKLSNDRSAPGKSALTLSDHLKWVYDHSKVSFVSDAFRVPTRSDRFLTNLRSPLDYLKELKKQERLLLSDQHGIVRVKTGGYWRLRRSEPPESATRALEASAKKGLPSVFQYADFVHVSDFLTYVRFEKPGRFVAKFDTRPLVTTRAPLYVIGALDTDSRKLLANNAIVDVISKMKGSLGQLVPNLARRSITMQEDWVRFRPDPAGIAFAGADALFQSGKPFGSAVEFLECTEMPGLFLESEGRLPATISANQMCGQSIRLNPDGTITVFITPQSGFSYNAIKSH